MSAFTIATILLTRTMTADFPAEKGKDLVRSSMNLKVETKPKVPTIPTVAIHSESVLLQIHGPI